MKRTALAAALAAASILALAGCASSSADADGRIVIVASTNVLGEIAAEIGGEFVDVQPIISSAAQDPHSYEATARDQLTLSRADLIIENGGGYDAFMDTLIETTGTDAAILTAVEFSPAWPGGAAHDDSDHDDEHADDDHADDEHGHDHIEGFNEHVWYDVGAMRDLAAAVQSELEALLPEQGDAFALNFAAFDGGIAGLEASLADIAAEHAGTSIFVTEPLPLYLTEAAGLVNITPEAFSEAVEEGQDVPPSTLLAALELIASGEARVVVVNAQTGGAETTQAMDAATGAGIPVLEFSETLPPGQTYVSWMHANITDLAEALAS